MGDAKEGFKKHGSSFTTDNPKLLTLQDAPEGPFYDERVNLPLIPEMVANVAAIGVKQPIIVSSFEGKLYVVEGRQRYKHWVAAIQVWRKLGEPIKPIPCIIQQIKPNDGEMIGISCNEHRQNDSPMLKVAKASRMLTMGWDEEAVATAFGIQVQQLKNWLKADSLSAPVKKLVEQGKIAVSAAVKFADLPPAEQKEKAEALIESGVKPTVKAATKAVAGGKIERRVTEKEKSQDFYAAIERLKGRLGPSEKCAAIYDLLEKVSTLHSGECTEDDVWEAIQEI